jgi:hypothetical protein
VLLCFVLRGFIAYIIEISLGSFMGV